MRVPGSRKERGVVDVTVCDVAEQVAARFSRRSILHNLAAGLAAVVGVKFAAPHVVDTLIRMPLAEGAPVPQGGGGPKLICNHDDKNPCSLAGRQCGMGNLVDCAAYKREDTSKGKCRNCMGNKGCPKGTVKSRINRARNLLREKLEHVLGDGRRS